MTRIDAAGNEYEPRDVLDAEEYGEWLQQIGAKR